MTFRNRSTVSTAALFCCCLAGLAPGETLAASCDVDRPIVLAGLEWDSARFHNAMVERFLEAGYGCTVDVLPGATIPLSQGVGRGDIDIMTEVWTANTNQAWLDAAAAGTVVTLGTTYPDAEEGWYVPRYLVEGDGAKAPGLAAVADLEQYKELFADPEEPSKGRFYNCIAGWQCEVINSKKLIAYGLEDDYTNFRPGSGAALSAAVESAVLRQQPIVFYHWTPTWLMGKHDFVRLEEPPFDRTVWEEMLATDRPERATAYPQSASVVGANKRFVDSAPNVVAFLNAYGMTSALTSQALAVMQDSDGSTDAAIDWFIENHADLWTTWVDAETADKVRASVRS